MTVRNLAWQSGWTHGSWTTSLQVNFAPTKAVAQCSLSQASGEGLCAGGITQYRTRTTPSGPDHDHDFGVAGARYWLPPVGYDPLMSSVSAELDTGEDQQGTLLLMVSLWS